MTICTVELPVSIQLAFTKHILTSGTPTPNSCRAASPQFQGIQKARADPNLSPNPNPQDVGSALRAGLQSLMGGRHLPARPSVHTGKVTHRNLISLAQTQVSGKIILKLDHPSKFWLR